MKTMKYLGCLLALVFAGASAFAATWFENSVNETLGTGWSNTTGWTWKDGAGSYNNWTAPLTYTRSDDAQPLASKDSTITTSVKFTAMDAEDLAEQTIGDDVKGGLTVVEDASTTPATLSYYGIVNVGNEKKWKPLTGADPTLEAFVDVTVELKNNLNNTYTITYKVGGEALTVASGSSFTMATANEATISTVEYLGQFSLASLAGATWYNPCTVESPIIAGIKEGSVKAYDANIEPLKEYALNKIPRGATVEFAFEAADNYFVSVKDATYTTTGGTATEAVTWGNYVVATEMPTGTDTPSKITVDEADVATRIQGGAKGSTTAEYLFSKQDNGQPGWVNVTLGLNDDASGTIAATNATPVEGAVAISFGVDVPAGATVTYNVGADKGLNSPNIGLDDDKSQNIGIVDVEMVLKDEGGENHVIATAKVGVMETGKNTPDQTTGKTFDIVAVPWNSFGGAEISVNDLLNTAMLTEDDKLYVWNGSVYDIYTLNASGAWIAGTQTKRDSKTGTTLIASPDPAKRTITQGTAIWIERDVNSRIVFAGLAGDVTKAYQADVAAGGETEATWSLIANPSINAFDLSSIKDAVNGDKVIVEDEADPREYTFNGATWSYLKTERKEVTRGSKKVTMTSQVEVSDDNVIPAGIGFWYVRKAGFDGFKITFEANADKE